MELTIHPSVSGGRVVHALMGGGPAFDCFERPYYFRNHTWCGVERRSRLLLVETDAPPTCKTCLRLLRSHREQVKTGNGEKTDKPKEEKGYGNHVNL